MKPFESIRMFQFDGASSGGPFQQSMNLLMYGKLFLTVKRSATLATDHMCTLDGTQRWNFDIRHSDKAVNIEVGLVDVGIYFLQTFHHSSDLLQ